MTNSSDLRDQPAYSPSEAAKYLKLPAATLRSWVAGRSFPKAKGIGEFKPLIHPPRKQPATLSFWNLIEAHVLRSLRTEHGVSLSAVRKALQYAERKLSVERLLLSKQLRTDAGRVFLERYGEIIELSASGQLAMRQLLEEHLKRVEWDDRQFPVRLYPFLSAELVSPERLVVIDPTMGFGRPVLVSTGVSTAAIAERIDAGESVAALAADYELSETDIQQAVLFERAA
ncbi:MAG TPA: DUF433 domain-containing protein [Candidatus Polarisedimenticolaceae bacterium]|nr:DUF433 domain-containing protein [Candidatus Polarisedimenticolaceae bacterium]